MLTKIIVSLSKILDMEEDNGLVLGVCARVSKQTNINVWVYRALFLLTIGTGGGIVYLLLAFLMD